MIKIFSFCCSCKCTLKEFGAALISTNCARVALSGRLVLTKCAASSARNIECVSRASMRFLITNGYGEGRFCLSNFEDGKKVAAASASWLTLRSLSAGLLYVKLVCGHYPLIYEITSQSPCALAASRCKIINIFPSKVAQIFSCSFLLLSLSMVVAPQFNCIELRIWTPIKTSHIIYSTMQRRIK